MRLTYHFMIFIVIYFEFSCFPKGFKQLITEDTNIINS